MPGLWGKILRVDLSKPEIKEEAIPEDWARKFMGGRGLAARYLIEDVPKGADPLGPENELIYMTGALTGTPSPSSGRTTICAKSPLTGIWGYSNTGGYWGPSFKGNGFDGIIFRGISPEPVCLVIEEGKPELRDAKHLWGKNVWETTKTIKEELGEDFEVSAIGIAGEKMVRFACPINDDHRAAGRCGMGTVMGSKRLKAIAVRGTKETEIGNKEAFLEVANKNYELLNESLLKVTLEVYGTNAFFDMANERGAIPTRNFQTCMIPEPEKLNATTMTEQVLVDRKACFACPIKCGRVSKIRTGPYKDTIGEGPEYETMACFGCMCELYKAPNAIDVVTEIHNHCDNYGLDVISCGNTIAFAMECYEKGVLTKEDTDGLELTFGNAEAAIELVHKIAKREGVGDLLAEGTKRMAQKLGRGTERFAINVKGLELAGWEPRGGKLTGLQYATSNRGGCHVSALAEVPSVVADVPLLIVEDTRIEDPHKEGPRDTLILRDLENACALFDSSGACKFMGIAMSYEEWVKIISSVLGRDFTFDEYKKVGERVYNLERVFNVREGITRADDTLPPRIMEEPLPEGPVKGDVNKLSNLDAYYEIRGWDKRTGKPTPEKLRELELEELIKWLS